MKNMGLDELPSVDQITWVRVATVQPHSEGLLSKMKQESTPEMKHG